MEQIAITLLLLIMCAWILAIGFLLFMIWGIRRFWMGGQRRAKRNRQRLGWKAKETFGVLNTTWLKNALEDEDLTPEEHRSKYGW